MSAGLYQVLTALAHAGAVVATKKITASSDDADLTSSILLVKYVIRVVVTTTALDIEKLDPHGQKFG